MATVYQAATAHRHDAHGHGGYTTYQEPDTRVPPKARPVLKEISVNGVAVPEQDILAEAQHHPAENPGRGARRGGAGARRARASEAGSAAAGLSPGEGFLPATSAPPRTRP